MKEEQIKTILKERQVTIDLAERHIKSGCDYTVIVADVKKLIEVLRQISEEVNQ